MSLVMQHSGLSQKVARWPSTSCSDSGFRSPRKPPNSKVTVVGEPAQLDRHLPWDQPWLKATKSISFSQSSTALPQEADRLPAARGAVQQPQIDRDLAAHPASPQSYRQSAGLGNATSGRRPDARIGGTRRLPDRSRVADRVIRAVLPRWPVGAVGMTGPWPCRDILHPALPRPARPRYHMCRAGDRSSSGRPVSGPARASRGRGRRNAIGGGGSAGMA